MKQITVLVVALLVVVHVKSYAHSHKNTRSPVSRKILLVNLLRALRKLRNYKPEKRTGVGFRKSNDKHSSKEKYIETRTTNLVQPITGDIDGIQSLRFNKQIGKRSNGLKKKSKGNPKAKFKKGNKLFRQLLETLKSINKQNEKQRRRTHLTKNYMKQRQKITQNNHFPTTLSWKHEQRNQLSDIDQRSSVLRPIKKLTKIGTTQTSKARYSFSQARLSFLRALETAQDEKLSKLGNLQKRFSYILPKNENVRPTIRKDVKDALQDFKNDESATRLSKIHQPNKNSFIKPSLRPNTIKKHILKNAEETQNSSPRLMKQQQKNNSLLLVSKTKQNRKDIREKIKTNPKVDLKSTAVRILPTSMENGSHQIKKPNELFPSMMDELLSISSARNKVEKLKRLQKLQAKLLHHFSLGKTKKDHENNFEEFDDKNMYSSRFNDKLNRPITQNVGVPLFDNLKQNSKYKNQKKNVYDKPNKRHEEQQGFQKDGKKDGQKLSGEVGYIDQDHIAKPPREYIDTFDDFVASPQSGKKPTNSRSGYTNNSGLGMQLTSGDSVKTNSNRTNNTEQEIQGKMTKVHLSGIPLKVDRTQLHYQYPSGHGSKVVASFPESSKSSLNSGAMKGDANYKHHNVRHTALQQKQHAAYFDNPAQDQERNHSQMQDINIIGEIQQSHFHKSPSQYSSSTNKNGSEMDHSYLPLDSSAMTAESETKDSTNPLPSVLSENEKIISQLKASKTLAKNLTNNKTENSHRRLAKILQKAQIMFIEKVKEILAGHKTTGNKKSRNNIKSNKTPKKYSQKSKGGVINTSAYVMDESPAQATKAEKVSQDNSGIVPKTPTNDDLLNSVNGKMVQTAPQSQMSAINTLTQSLIQSQLGANSAEEVPSVAQPGSGQPVSGQPLTYAQLQDAHEEERVALEQENTFRNMQNGGKSLNGVSTPFQSYMGPSYQLPQGTHYAIRNTGFNPPNVDDLSEYTGGMERYQLSHQMGYGGNADNENGVDYFPRKNPFPLYQHQVEDDEDDEDYDDDDDQDDEDIEEGKKKSSIGKPHDFVNNKHRRMHYFRNTSNSTKIELIRHHQIHVKPKFNSTNAQTI